MKAHLVGGGIASLTAAAYLIKDAGFLGTNVHVYESGDGLGGCLRGYGNAEDGYVIPVGRMFERNYRCMKEFLSFIPSRSDPSRPVWEEMEEFHEQHGWYSKSRLIGRGSRILDASDFGLSLADKLAFARLMLTPEAMIETKRIDEWFEPDFFRSHFWFMWVPVMGTLPQHSLVELKRYFNRFMHLLPDLPLQTEIYRTRFHQDEAIRQPVEAWLKRNGVAFHLNATVRDVDFVPSAAGITAQGLVVDFAGEVQTLDVGRRDIVLVTNGSQIGDVSMGSMHAAPKLNVRGNSWKLWETLARGRKNFGNPHAFFNRPESLWIDFTVTARDPEFLERLESFAGMPTGRQGLITFVDSHWFMTIVTFHQPHFFDQPKNVQLWWGYGVYPDRPGNFVKKPMRECSGAELMEEVLHHLGFEDSSERIIANSICISCALPEANSVWAVRSHLDRPRVVPEGSTNFGFIGQFTEMPDDVMFTMEYSMRSARTAVIELLHLDRRPPAPYQGMHDPNALYGALKSLT